MDIAAACVRPERRHCASIDSRPASSNPTPPGGYLNLRFSSREHVETLLGTTIPQMCLRSSMAPKCASPKHEPSVVVSVRLTGSVSALSRRSGTKRLDPSPNLATHLHGRGSYRLAAGLISALLSCPLQTRLPMVETTVSVSDFWSRRR